MRHASREQGGATIANRLRERRVEIEQAMLTRVYAVSEPPPRSGPEYAEGLRAAVSAGVDYGLEGIERGELDAPPAPGILLTQARLAARWGVSLDTVLRRYLAAHALLDDFIVEGVEAEGLYPPTELKRLLRSQAAIVDRLIATVSEAYGEEAVIRRRNSEERRAERIERLLAGEPIDTTGLGYELDQWHVGVAACGPGAQDALAHLAESPDRRLLVGTREEGTVWGWLGSKRGVDPAVLVDRSSQQMLPSVSIAIGEAGEGLSGWRLTHRQARAALPIAKRRIDRLARYADVALVASMMRDDLLLASLRELYLDRLATERDGGKSARQTLCAYFDADQNVSSAAAALGISRQAVGRRLRSIERRIGRPLRNCAVELQVALRLCWEEFEDEPSSLVIKGATLLASATPPMSD